MKIVLAFAILAVASATSIPQPIELPAPALPAFQMAEDIPAAAAVEPAQLEDAVIPVNVVDAAEEVVLPVIVVDSSDVQAEPMNAPETSDDKVDAVKVVDLPVAEEAHAPLVLPIFSMPDIRPLIVPQEVMRQIAEMIAQEAAAFNADDASIFEYSNVEPLDIEPVQVDSPASDMDTQVDPVIVVDEAVNDRTAPLNSFDAPETVKVVDGPMEFPQEYLRDSQPQYHQVPANAYPPHLIGVNNALLR